MNIDHYVVEEKLHIAKHEFKGPNLNDAHKFIAARLAFLKERKPSRPVGRKPSAKKGEPKEK